MHNPHQDNIFSHYQAEIDQLNQNHLIRSSKAFRFGDNQKVTLDDGTELICFSSNDYLGLANDKRIITAGQNAIGQYGSGARSARMICGEHPLYKTLESNFANYYGSDNALIFGNGYLANLATISTLAQKGDLILADKLAHACIIDGAMLSDAKFMRFKHNDIEHCKKILHKHRKNARNTLIAIEQVYSMDGDFANLQEFIEIAKFYNCLLLIDHAHAISQRILPKDKRLIHTGTMSKFLASYGGYVCGNEIIIQYIRQKARSSLFSTALPPTILATANTAFNIWQNEKWRSQAAIENANYFAKLISYNNSKQNIYSHSQIIPIIIGENQKSLEIEKILFENGFLVKAIRPPTVPQNTARLRLSFCSDHNKEHIEKIALIISHYLANKCS